MTRILRQNHTGNRLVDKTSRDIQQFAALASQSPFWEGSVVTATLSTLTTQVNHQLGRAYRGWIVVRLLASYGVLVFEPAGVATPTSSLTSIPLTASGPCTVTLWCY